MIIINISFIFPSILHQYKFQNTFSFNIFILIIRFIHTFKTLNHTTPITHSLNSINIPINNRFPNNQTISSDILQQSLPNSFLLLFILLKLNWSTFLTFQLHSRFIHTTKKRMFKSFFRRNSTFRINHTHSLQQI